MELQITEFGASSIKFYPVGWRCDDEKFAYPLYEKARSLGVDVIQFHKNLPTLRENVESQGPHDLQQVARDFPDMTILLHHPMQLYFYETVSIAQRNPNIFLVVTPLIHYSLYRPRLAQELFGHLLHEVGSDKLIWGSEGVLVGNPTRILDAFAKLEIPPDLREGYGFPQFTDRDRANILGTTLATVFGIDVNAPRSRSWPRCRRDASHDGHRHRGARAPRPGRVGAAGLAYGQSRAGERIGGRHGDGPVPGGVHRLPAQARHHGRHGPQDAGRRGRRGTRRGRRSSPLPEAELSLAVLQDE